MPFDCVSADFQENPGIADCCYCRYSDGSVSAAARFYDWKSVHNQQCASDASSAGFDMKLIQSAIPNAFTIAVLAAIESLLSCVVADGMINSKHRSDTELIAQGAGNIAFCAFRR